MTNTRRLVTTAVAAAACAALLACGSTPRTHKQLSQIRSNPTPELVTLSQTQNSVDNDWAIYLNEMQRMRTSDLSRAFYTDRPSRLTPMPMSK